MKIPTCQMKKCTCCSSCKKKSNRFMETVRGKKISNNKYHYVMVAVVLAIISFIFVKDVAEEGEKFLYYTPHKGHFKRPPSTFLTSLEFDQEDIKEKKQNMAWQMDYSCEATSNDVIFSFQYVRSEISNTTYNDHIFMMCESHRAFGNAEIVYRGNDFILCTEEYAGILQKKKRSANVTIKAIDIQQWKPIQYESKNEMEACQISHAVEMLNNVWKV